MKKRHFTFGLILALLLLLIAAFLILNPKCYRCQYTENAESILYLKNGDVHLCYNNFPDDAFRAFVAKTLNLQEGDTVPLSQLQGITELDCSGLGIYDLTGIHVFSNLKKLNCSNNRLSRLNPNYVSTHKSVDAIIFPKLEFLDCSYNMITNLSLIKIESLNTLICTHNQMTYLYVPHQNLEYLDCSYNRLQDISHYSFSLNKIIRIDYSNNSFSKDSFPQGVLPRTATVINDSQVPYKNESKLCNHDYQGGFLFIPGRCIHCGQTERQSVHKLVRLIALPLCIAGGIFAIIYIRRRNKQIKDWENKDTNRTHEDPQTYTN